MTTLACILGDPALRLWGLTSRERLLRQLRAAGVTAVTDDPRNAPAGARVVILHAAYLFEQRTVNALLRHERGMLECPRDGGIAAAVVAGTDAAACAEALAARGAARPNDLPVLQPATLEQYDNHLRRHEPPLLEPIRADNAAGLESLLYGNSYKGITDCVTKWVWPRPARVLVKLCATVGLTPNMVTGVGLALVVAASWLFAHGHFALGLACGWFMTLLDTVDGKLARVTVQSSPLGHWLDHGMDIIHPPIWYVLWGSGLAGADPAFITLMNWLVVGGYLAGRAFEGAFEGLGRCSMFAWRPFDAYFRLITARRNPCLIILTTGLALGRPDWALAGVGWWTAGSSALLGMRLLYAATVRLRSGPLESWLADPDAANLYPAAYRTFSGTRRAYA